VRVEGDLRRAEDAQHLLPQRPPAQVGPQALRHGVHAPQAQVKAAQGLQPAHPAAVQVGRHERPHEAHVAAPRRALAGGQVERAVEVRVAGGVGQADHVPRPKLQPLDAVIVIDGRHQIDQRGGGALVAVAEDDRRRAAGQHQRCAGLRFDPGQRRRVDLLVIAGDQDHLRPEGAGGGQQAAVAQAVIGVELRRALGEAAPQPRLAQAAQGRHGALRAVEGVDIVPQAAQRPDPEGLGHVWREERRRLTGRGRGAGFGQLAGVMQRSDDQDLHQPASHFTGWPVRADS